MLTAQVRPVQLRSSDAVRGSLGRPGCRLDAQRGPLSAHALSEDVFLILLCRHRVQGHRRFRDCRHRGRPQWRVRCVPLIGAVINLFLPKALQSLKVLHDREVRRSLEIWLPCGILRALRFGRSHYCIECTSIILCLHVLGFEVGVDPVSTFG